MKPSPYGSNRWNLCGLKLILFSSFVVAALLVPYFGWAQQRQMHTPVITHAYAAQQGESGKSWKIYIEAEDAGGDMNYVYVVVDQTGRSSYPERLLLDPRHQSHLKAFVEWKRVGSGLSEGAPIAVRISIADRAGNVSNEAVFPFTFVSEAGVEQDVPTPFDGMNIPRIGYMGAPHYEPGPS